MPLFGDDDIDEIPSDPFYVAPDTYEAVVSDASVQEKNDNSGDRGFSIRYQITEEGDYFHNTVQEWKDIIDKPNADCDTNERRKKSFLKQRLEQLGVPQNEMNTLDENPETLVGIEGYVTIKETNDKHDPTKKYTNVVSFKLYDPAE